MGAFEGLLREVAGAVKAMAAQQEDILGRVREVERDLSNMKADLATLKEAKKWDHKERRKVDGRLETGDHTFEKLAVQIKQVEGANNAVVNAVQRSNTRIGELEKKLDVASNRKFALIKMAIGAVLTAALAFLTSWATAKLAASSDKARVELKETGGRP